MYVPWQRYLHSKVFEDLAKQGQGFTLVPNSRHAFACLFSYIMGWRILYIDEGEYLSLYIDNIKIQNKGEDKEIILPIKDLHTLIIDNYKSVLSVHLMNALSNYNVNVVLCNIEHMPATLIIPQSGNAQVPQMLKHQLSWTARQKQLIHQEIVKSKIKNQYRLLQYFGLDENTINKLIEYENHVQLGDVGNREGLAAKLYFKSLFGKSFIRFSDDTINAGLNYGYSILRSQISKTIIAKGLNPALGFFHKGNTNNFNLSDDFIEPFRPLIDYYIYMYLKDEQLLTKNHKLDIIKHTTKKVTYNQSKQTLFNAINQYVDAVISFMNTGDLDKLKHPIMVYDDL